MKEIIILTVLLTVWGAWCGWNAWSFAHSVNPKLASSISFLVPTSTNEIDDRYFRFYDKDHMPELTVSKDRTKVTLYGYSCVNGVTTTVCDKSATKIPPPAHTSL